MKIYFTASSAYRNVYKPIYERVVNFLENKGHEVFGNTLSEEVPQPYNTTAHTIKGWHKEWSSYISECDLVIVEASYPSTIHIGFEIGMILSRGKPTILLFKEGKDPIYINEFYANKFVKSEYTEKSLEDVLAWCLDEIEHISNRRFTFFISTQIETFLDGVSKKKGISRSEYIRKLIEEKMPKETH